MAFDIVPQTDCKTSESPKPPITNRGAEITIPVENRSLIDWAGFTFKTTNPQEIPEQLGLPPSLFAPFPFGFSGYRKSLRFGNISIYYEGREDMGCHVEMTGQGCRQYEAQFTSNPWNDLFQRVLEAQGKFTRLDLALDTVDGSLPLTRLCAAVKEPGQIRTLFGEWRRIQKGPFAQGKDEKGETLYLGSSKSHVQFRIYNKAQQLGIEGDWIRFEIQLRDKRAHEAVRLLVASPSVGLLTTGIINHYFAVINTDDTNVSRCSLQDWWAAWLQSTEKIGLSTEKAIKLVSDTMDFIKRQYAPSLAMIKQHLGPQPFKAYVGAVLEEGQDRMSAKHQRILAASSNKRPQEKDSGSPIQEDRS